MRVQPGAGREIKCCRDCLETNLEYCIQSIPKRLHSGQILCLYDLKQSSLAKLRRVGEEGFSFSLATTFTSPTM